MGASALGVSTLTLGAAVGQGIQLAGSVVLARVYSPAQFGVFATAMAVATMLATVATLQYPGAIPLAHTDDEAREINWMAIFVALAGSLLAALLLAGYVNVVGGDFFSDLGPSLWLVVPLGFVLAVWTSVRNLQSRLGGFTAVGVSGVIGALTQVAAQIVLGLLGFVASGLTTGYAVGRVANLAAMVRRGVFGHPPSVRRMGRLIRVWRRMPLWILTPTFLNVLSINAAAALVAGLFGVETAGYFSLALSMLAVPSTLLGQAVATVIYPHTARLDRDAKSAVGALEKAVEGLFVMGVPFFGLITVLGPQLFAFVFGDKWAQAGVVAALISPWLLVNLVSSPISGFAFVRGRERFMFVFAIVEALLRVGALTIGGAVGSATVGIALYGGAGVLVSTAATAFFLHLAGSSLLGIIVRSRRYLTAVVVGYGLLAVFGAWAPTLPVALLASLVTAAFGAVAVRRVAGLMGLL